MQKLTLYREELRDKVATVAVTVVRQLEMLQGQFRIKRILVKQ